MSSPVVTATGSLSAATDVVVLGMPGAGGVSFQVYGTWVGTIAFDGAVDGVTFQALSTTTLNALTTGTTTTANGIFQAGCAGLTAVRARCSAHTSGVAMVRIQAIDTPPAWQASITGAGSGTSSAYGAAFPASGTAAGFLGFDGNMAPGELDVDGNLNVNLASGSIAISDVGVQGMVAADADASLIKPVLGGGYASAGAPASVSADGDAVNGWFLRNGAQATVVTAAGALIGGDAANGLDVDVTRVGGTVTVSGTVAATQSGTWTVQPGNTANTTAWKVDGSAVTQPISAATLPLPTGAATLAAQTQPGVDIGDVTVNNAGAGSAVNIQDGGNSITVDGTVTAAQATAASLNATVVGTGTFVVQENGAALTSLQLIDDTVATTASAIPAKGLAVSGTDGTNARVIKTDTSGELQVDVLTSGLPTGAATETTLATLKAALSVTYIQLTASGDTDVLASGTRKIHRIEASNSHATTALVVGFKNANLNSGAVFGKKYLPAAGGQGVWVFPDSYLQITSSTFVGNLSAAGTMEVTVYYE